MANKPQGPRQPLSQRRPKVATTRANTRPGPPTTKARGKSAAQAGAPSRQPVRGNGRTPNANATPRSGKPTRSARGPAARTAAPKLDSRRVVEFAVASPQSASPDSLYNELLKLYPDAHCELDYTTPFQLLVATILSAQCTDKRVNLVTPALFTRYPTVAALAAARQEDVEEIIKSTGFFRNKAKSIIAMANALVERHGGDVPSAMDALVVLPGVGRKTANVILGNAFGINDGVVVDTHVGRLAIRLGLTRETDPVKVEQELMGRFPRERWTMLSHLLIWHGRRVCEAKRPRCAECALQQRCPSAFRV